MLRGSDGLFLDTHTHTHTSTCPRRALDRSAETLVRQEPVVLCTILEATCIKTRSSPKDSWKKGAHRQTIFPVITKSVGCPGDAGKSQLADLPTSQNSF